MKQCITILLFVYSTLSFSQPSHELWTDILQTYVSSEGNVDYKGLFNNPKKLREYISQLQNNTPNESWSKNEKLAYWINAYNALTIELVLRHYPLNSIKDIKKPWDQELFKSNDKWLSLNDIEHNILRKLDDPRIHFAIVCASASCPKLQNEAFTSEHLEAQLNNATTEFVLDVSRNKVSNDRLQLSKIFRWFAKDFKAEGGVVNFINKYTKIEVAPNVKISYLDYNWDLNE